MIDSITKSLVTRMCATIHDCINSQYISEQHDTNTLLDAIHNCNRLGIMPKVKIWYESSEQYGEPLEEYINKVLAESDMIESIHTDLTRGDSYWNQWGLTGETTADNLRSHTICYDLCVDISNALLSKANTQKITSCVNTAAGLCLSDQLDAVYSAFFSTGPSLVDELGSAGLSSTATVQQNFKTIHSCDDTTVISYQATSSSSSGDLQAEETAKDTFSSGSQRQTWDRKSHNKISEPAIQHLNTASTLHSVLMTSDLSEENKDASQHARLCNTYNQINTTCDVLQQTIDFFNGSQSVVYDRIIDERENQKLQTRSLQNQAGEFSVVVDDSGDPSTRTHDQTTTS